MNSIVGLVLTLSLVTCPAARSQSIVAGTVSVGDLYFDLVPDSTLEVLPVHLSPYPPAAVVLDLDQDGSQDIQFSTSGGGGLGGGGGACTVGPLVPHSAVASHLGTFDGCCPGVYTERLADTIPGGSVIDGQSEYFHYPVYLWNQTYGAQPGAYIGTWLNTGEHFVGVRLAYPPDTLYCWVRVQLTDGNPFVFFVRDHACNINPQQGVAGSDPNARTSVYPDPFTDHLIVSCPRPDALELTLYDLSARPALHAACLGTIAIDTAHLVAGTYLYALRKNGEIVKQGKLIKN